MLKTMQVGTHGTFSYDEKVYAHTMTLSRPVLYARVKGIYDGTGITGLATLKKAELAAIVSDAATVH
jgi:hypothetical protein